jgi:broad specificity phosphatase PhoE
MTAIWLVRHAATDWTGVRWCGRTDLALSADGRAQAAELARTLGPDLGPGTVVVTSPARRARETAAAIAAVAGSPTIIEPDLAEVDFGSIDGRTFAEIERDEPAIAASILAPELEIDWPGGESAAAARARIGRAWDRMAGRGVTVVVVTHGGVLRWIARLDPGAAAVLAGADLGPASAVLVPRLISRPERAR